MANDSSDAKPASGSTNRPTPEVLRRIQLLATAAKDPDSEALRSVERAIVEKFGIVDHTVDDQLLVQRRSGESDTSAFQASQRYARASEAALVAFWDRLKRKHGARDKFELALCTPTQFVRFWHARRVVDSLHVPYGPYLTEAVRWWLDRGEAREPTPGQLTSGEAVLGVMERWQGKSND